VLHGVTCRVLRWPQFLDLGLYTQLRLDLLQGAVRLRLGNTILETLERVLSLLALGYYWGILGAQEYFLVFFLLLLNHLQQVLDSFILCPRQVVLL
jgi:hypothetical protein